MQKVKRHHLYRIINLVNGKIYIGQTVQPEKRWTQHKYDSANSKMIISHAIKNYGNENFVFEVIVSGVLPCTCQAGQPGQCQHDANDGETLLVKQYESHVSTGKGYNVSNGGLNAPKTEAFKQMLRDWHASLSPEDKEVRSKKLLDGLARQIATYGHPSLGAKRTDEQRARMSAAQQAKDKEAIYTPEVRQRMSEAHIGLKASEEAKKNLSEAVKLVWDERLAKAMESGELKCNAPGCDAKGRLEYIILGGIRYCNTHGQRLRRTGFLELQPRTSHNKGKTGELSHSAKLTWEIVANIRQDYANGLRGKKLIEKYGISESNMYRVVKNEVWKA